MRGSLRAVAGFGVLALATSRLIAACGGDDDAAPPDPFTNDADLPERNLGPDPDAEPNGDGTVVVIDPPSFCNGIVFYASLDGTYAPERGNTPPSVHANAQLVGAGKFGGAASFYEDGGAGDGAAVYYYTPPDGGLPWYSRETGTVSLWYRGTALVDTSSPVLWRVTASLAPAPGAPPVVVGGGLALVTFADRFGIYLTPNSGGQTEILGFPRGAMRPYFDDANYNHFVTAWQTGDASQPTAVMMLNGGTGKVIDAAADAPSYADAGPNEAGDLLVPYRGVRNRPWDTDASAIAFRLGGTGTSASDGEIDDVAVWNRVLSLSEMEAVYAANAPIGTVCKLK